MSAARDKSLSKGSKTNLGGAHSFTHTNRLFIYKLEKIGGQRREEKTNKFTKMAEKRKLKWMVAVSYFTFSY